MAVPLDASAQYQTFKSYLAIIAEPATTPIEKKLKAAQELSENLETVLLLPLYPQFLQEALRVFLKILQDGEPHFIADLSHQQLRKLLLEIIHRIPANDHLKPYAKAVLNIIFRLLEIDNEENVLICLRIIIELHKQFRPQMSVEVQNFLQLVKKIYKDLGDHMPKIFDPKLSIKVKDLSEVNIDSMLLETFAATSISTENKNAENQAVTYNLLPKAVLSLKVLAELPIIVVLLYQLYKQQVHNDISDFIPLIMNAITLQPTQQQRSNPSFNKEIFVDFMAAQIKTLSLLAYIIRMYQEVVSSHAQQLVKGVLGLLMLCPQEVAHLRKELLIAARHILATDLRIHFVPVIDKLFDENILIGSGWTAKECLRSSAYSTLADFVHHVRANLSLAHLSMAINLFAKNIHDDSLPISIQTMLCKLLLNLVESIRNKSEEENGNGRELLVRMLEAFVLKFKLIAEVQLPTLLQGAQQQGSQLSQPMMQQVAMETGGDAASSQAPPTTPLPSAVSLSTPAPGTPSAEPKTLVFPRESSNGIGDKEDPNKAARASSQSPTNVGASASTAGAGGVSGGLATDSGKPPSSATYTVPDCRVLVKTLVSGVKTITWAIVTSRSPTADKVFVQSKLFLPGEEIVYVRLVRYALVALDIYTISSNIQGQMQIRPAVVQTVRTKEEKEVLEHFAGVFTMMSQQSFKEIFASTIEFLVDRIHANNALQIIANSFLANRSMSATFATILVEYLLGRMDEMGNGAERSNLYLKLFKLVFGSVSLLAAENEQMLKPHLHTIVNKSMELALTAKEPYNYFLLLRALFRSIGGGSHDLLYQEFLPLLPTLLQGLNGLQSGLHKQHMKDLFVELCLTVPVRLSSLLPYLPMLMDPLVSALNGSQTLISQGLRTLELCVDNLQPDFLYDHIQPVRAELMQALWRCMRNPPDSVAHAAFRVLGKFGGSNRKMLNEPQQLTYNNQEGSGPAVNVLLPEYKLPVTLTVQKAIDTALGLLKSSTTESFYLRQAWQVVKCYLVSSLSLDDDRNSLVQLFMHSSFTDQEISSTASLYKCTDPVMRAVHESALVGMFLAAAIKELRAEGLPFMAATVRHYTLVAIAQQSGPFPLTADKVQRMTTLDPHVLIDALAVIMAYEEKELCKPGKVAMFLILDTATNVLGSKERACQLPLCEYMIERLCALCYEKAWYAKLGGCMVVKFMVEQMSVRWVLEHQYVFLRALLFVMMDLTGEVSSGALDLAKANLEDMLKLCASITDPDLVPIQSKYMFDVIHELVRQVASPITLVREQCVHGLEVIASALNKTVTEVMEPHKDVLQDMVPPKKHLLRYQALNAQIGLIEANTFCTSLEPRLFTIDLKTVEHKVFFTELLNLCEADDSMLLKLPCYKSVHTLVPFRKSTMRALAACNYIDEKEEREKIFKVLYKWLETSTNLDLQKTAYECLKKFLSGFQIDMEMVHQTMRSMLTKLGDHRSLTVNTIEVLASLTQLFPNSFKEKLCEQLLAHLKKWLETEASNFVQRAGQVAITGTVRSEELVICCDIINLFHLIPAASTKMIEPLVSTVLKAEEDLNTETSSPFRESLMKLLLRYPVDTLDYLLSNSAQPQYARLCEWLVSHKNGRPFREVLEQDSSRLLRLMGDDTEVVDAAAQSSRRFLGICLVRELINQNSEWLQQPSVITERLLSFWTSESYQQFHQNTEGIDYLMWQEPNILVDSLLTYFKLHTNEIELLFHLLRCLISRYMANFQALKDFLEETVAKTYPIEWRRQAFFKFVDVFHDQSWSQDLKAKILQLIIIPCFLNSFEKGDGEQLIGGPPSPDQDNTDNVISVFINRIIDPDNPFGTSDAVRILLLQFSSLLVENAAPHIHDAANKRQGNKLRRLMTFAWPCLLSKNCVDPATKYHGHLLLAHIIAKFAIHKRIVVQVFHSLLKAHAAEAKAVVKQALDILTPAMPLRMEDGHTMLKHWTKKIIIEEHHTVPQLAHILQLIVRHAKIYYPVRHHLIQHMVNSMQRLGFSPNAAFDQRKLAVDLADVIIQWEMQRLHEDQEQAAEAAAELGLTLPAKRLSTDAPMQDAKKPRHISGQSRSVSTEANQPIDKSYCDDTVNFLLKMACQVTEATASMGSPTEMLSRRCVQLLKKVLSPDVWPSVELRLSPWMEKLLLTVEQQQPNFTNICTALELLSFLLMLMKEPLLPSLKPLQRCIAACMLCPNSKVIRSVHSLLSRLMNLFPTEPPTSNVYSKHEELESLYSCIGKVVIEGLTNYEKSLTTSPSQLFGTLMVLKAACMHNNCYIDRLITPFMKVLHHMTRDHLSQSVAETNPVATELLILGLDMVKNRVGVMSPDMRKGFIGTILVGLIEKTQDAKVMKAITKMVEDWVKTKSTVALNQSPSLREKAILLAKLMQQLEKRFSDNQDLNLQFLELVNFIYRDDTLTHSELTSKLEPAFLSGLRCSQAALRQKFVEVFDRSIRYRLYDRLLYMVCSQNWESMGTHFWVKQCIELVLTIAVSEHEMQNASAQALLPSAASIVNMADSHDKAAFSSSSRPRLDTMESEAADTAEGEDIDIEMGGSEETSESPKKGPSTLRQNLQILLQRQAKFIESCREVKTTQYLAALCQLCHINTQLAHDTWVELLPKLWKLLPERSQHHLAGQFGQFLCSGSHVIQKDSHPSALHTFLEAICQCSPAIPLRPCVLKYLGKTHNLWHRAALVLEQSAFDSGGLNLQAVKAMSMEYDFEQATTSPQQELLDALCDIYSLLKEEDLFVGLWQKRSKYTESNVALAYEQHGLFENAQLTFEQAMQRARQDHNQTTATPVVIPEYRLWEDHWIRCSKELNQWDHLLEYANMKGNTNPHLVLECAWRVSNWGLMKDALSQVELSCPREMAWKVNLYRGYIAICHPDDHHLNMIDRLVEVSTTLAVKEWRRLPPILSQCHVSLLQAAQQIMELSEAAQINHGLQPTNIGRETSLHDMKATVKTWRNRLPMISDDLSHWSDIFTWRQHHYQFIVNQYETFAQQDPQHQQLSMFGVHASALSIIHFGKIARKHGLTSVCLDSLSRIHSIPSVPIVDCFQKIRQQVKCYLQMSGAIGKGELQEGLEVIESTNLKYFTKEMTAEFYALKGLFLAQIGRSDDANKAFSAAVQMHDTLVKAWALWGDYLEGIFTKDRNMTTGVCAVTCYLHACRHQNESKSRKYLAKVIWLLTYDDDKCTLAEAVDKYNVGVPPLQWLPWIPQLLTCLVRPEGRLVLNLLSTVGRVYPQAVYFPLRTLYLTLKIEQRERHRETRQQSVDGRLGDMSTDVIGGGATSSSQEAEPAMPVTSQNVGAMQESIGQPAVAKTQVSAPPATPSSGSQEGQGSAPDGGPIKATPPMWRCSRIMQLQRDLHPTILLSLEGIVDNMVWFRENWYEEVLRQLRQALAKCYAIAFENRGAVTEAVITPSTLNFVRKLVSTFGVGIENVSGMAMAFSSAASESLARRAQASAQDPVFQKMKSQFTADFDFSLPGLKKLHNLISKLKKWIKVLEAKIKLLPKSFYIEEKCRFMSNFCQSTAEIELPGESLLPKHNHYFIHIARFLPKMEIVQKHNTSARRLYIRGHNGKVYPYLVMNDGCLTESRREERVLQLFRMMNHLLGKQKETCRRLLQFSVPRVVAVSPQMRLVEDNPATITLLDIYKQCCAKRNQEHDAPIARYYERLATVQARGSQFSHQVLRDILKEVQANIVPRGLLKEWASHTFPNATDYWTFRKNFTASLALEGVAEIVLHLSRLNPDMMYVHQDAGFVNVAYFKFDIDELTGDLDAKRPVPFRLTPNIAEFLTQTGVTGSLTAAMVASARCFVQPHYKFASYLRAMLRDEYITWHKKKQDEDNPTAQPSDMDAEQLIALVNKAVVVITTTLQNLATFEGAESRVNTLVAAANSHDNLCRMDPAWHPWL